MPVVIANNIAVNGMSPDNRKRSYRRDLLLAAALVASGLTMSGVAFSKLKTVETQMAQATPPLQSTPGAETKPSVPPEPTPAGTRPQDVPPEPARPDADAQKAGAQPALPPAPAEKTAPPIREK